MPGASRKYDVFLSYSSRDAESAARLNVLLSQSRHRGRRLKVFHAPTTVRVGESIPAAIAEALEHSRCLIALLSPDWIESEWTTLESEVALWRDPAARRRLILPILLRPTRLPPMLARLQHLRLEEREDAESVLSPLLDAIRWSIAEDEASEKFSGERRELLSSPILPWLGPRGPSFEFVWPEMIIDPEVRVRRRPGKEIRLSGWFESVSAVPGCVAIVGDAGAGKTTALRSITLSGAGDLSSQRVFVHAREVPRRIKELRARARRKSGLVLLVDGLDEAGDEMVSTIGAELGGLVATGVTVFVASRTDFFERQADVLVGGLGSLEEVLEVKAWARSDIIDFSERYASRVDDPLVASRVREILDSVPGAVDIASNPMRLTLLLYLLVTRADIDVLRLNEPYTLYEMFYSEWLNKERHRGTSGGSATAIVAAHVQLARWFYRHKGERSSSVREIGVEGWDELRLDSAFSDLLDFETSIDEGGEVVRGFRHETLGEHLIARSILHAFDAGGPVIDKALAITVADDVNGFVRSGLAQFSAARVSAIQANLGRRYDELKRDAESVSTDENERLREQILYYVGRLPVRKVPEVLVVASVSETTPLLRRAAALGAILHGNVEVEKRYLLMLDDASEARLNRSVQMVYFGDVHDDLHTFEDSGEDWSRTRRAIFRRLGGRSIRDNRLRQWDLRTLRSFIESRPGSVLSGEESMILRAIQLPGIGEEDRAAAIRQEIDLVLGLAGT
ncbi:TIR domain-containing protein [Micromonospora zingiberis]|uniref:TIR domain-containing protein n=1 Tax=Micromonospora zingiberis TaxID=2053011 RepID=A0A4R0GGP4_9ACTN|nr:TIR domain-containing protein [Micromonospora zingiberis]TCB96490.1 TIR domain-containing protein [Micromonospora zingiberis]